MLTGQERQRVNSIGLGILQRLSDRTGKDGLGNNDFVCAENSSEAERTGKHQGLARLVRGAVDHVVGHIIDHHRAAKAVGIIGTLFSLRYGRFISDQYYNLWNLPDSENYFGIIVRTEDLRQFDAVLPVLMGIGMFIAGSLGSHFYTERLHRQNIASFKDQENN